MSCKEIGTCTAKVCELYFRNGCSKETPKFCPHIEFTPSEWVAKGVG